MIVTPMRLILASASPRRRELLRQAGFDFETRPSGVQELRRVGESAEDFARRVAREKALEVAKLSPPGRLVLGADTVVAMNGEILGKPLDADDAARMLQLLAGRTHTVITGVCLIQAPGYLVALRHAATRVGFRPLDEKEIRDYVQSGEPMDKAGAYGIQGLASKFVSRIDGCYFNVVGLPISLVVEMLQNWANE